MVALPSQQISFSGSVTLVLLSVQNRSAFLRFTSSNTCKELKCEASFAEEPPFLAEQVAVETEGISVTLTNLTDEDLAGLTVYCHCLFDGTYFGGLTYAYPVDGIPTGESVTIQAEECYLGEAAVVRVTRNS